MKKIKQSKVCGAPSPLVILWVYCPNGASEYTFFGFEVMIADCSREWGELAVIRWEKRYTPWGGVAVDSQVPEQLGWLELGEQES
jgi:hypothetical protein